MFLKGIDCEMSVYEREHKCAQSIEQNDINILYYDVKDKAQEIALKVMGKNDELIDNLANANTYTYEEVITKYVQKRASLLGTRDIKNGFFE